MTSVLTSVLSFYLVFYIKSRYFNIFSSAEFDHNEGHPSEGEHHEFTNSRFDHPPHDAETGYEHANHGYNGTGELDYTDAGLNETEPEDSVNVTMYNEMLSDTWLNLTSVMDLFTQREYDNSSAVQALTAAYRYTLRQQKQLKTLPASQRKPFIVIEGLDRHTRGTLAKRLALHLQGHVVPNPPDTFDAVLKNLPPNSTLLTNGFYVLSTYIAALHVRYVVQKAPAIVPGYWLGRAAVTIARNFITRPPPFNSKFWVWPKDLVKPDIVFYLTDRFSLHQFDDHMMVQRYLHVFDNWLDPKCVPLVNIQSIETLMEEMEPYLQDL